MSLSGVYGESGRRDIRGADPLRDRPRRRSSRHVRHVWLGPQRDWSAARSKGGATRSCWRPSSARCRRRASRTASNGRPEYVQQACEASLKRLGEEVIDLYYQHRVDPDVPVEETVGAMETPGGAGQGALPRPVRGAARDASAAPTRCIRSPRCRRNIRCCTATEAEETREMTRALGIGFVAYAPLGRGFLTGAIKTFDDVDGRRAAHPAVPEARISTQNRALVAKIEAIAAREKLHAVATGARLAAGARRRRGRRSPARAIRSGWMRIWARCR